MKLPPIGANFIIFKDIKNIAMRNLIIAIIISIVGVQNLYAFVVDGVYYAVRPDDPTTVKVCKPPVGYSYESSTLNIPASVTHNGKVFKVVEYEKEAFSGSKTMIGTLTLSPNAPIIPERLCEFSRINSIIIPEGVTTIKDKAFNQSRVERVDIPNSVREIGNYAFGECELLGCLTVFPTIEKIGGGQKAQKIVIVTSEKPLYIDSQSWFAMQAPSIFIDRPVVGVNNPPTLGSYVRFAPEWELILGEYANNYIIESEALNAIMVLKRNPPFANSKIFNIDRNICKLYVRPQSIEEYGISPFWQDFRYIKEIRTGMDDFSFDYQNILEWYDKRRTSNKSNNTTASTSLSNPPVMGMVDVKNCRRYIVSMDNETPRKLSSKMHLLVDSIQKYSPNYDWSLGVDWKFNKGEVLCLPLQNPPSAVSVDVDALSKVKSIKRYTAKRKSPYILVDELLYEYDANRFPIKMVHKSYDKGELYNHYSIAYDGKSFITDAWNFQGDSLTNEVSILADSKGHIGVIKEKRKGLVGDKKKIEYFVYVFLFNEDGIARKCVRFGREPYGIEDKSLVERYWAINSYEEWLEEVNQKTDNENIIYIEYNSNGDYYINDNYYSSSPFRFNPQGARYQYSNTDAVEDNYEGLVPRYQNRTYKYPFMPFEYELPIEWSGCISNHESSYETPHDDDIYKFKKTLDRQERLITFETLKLGRPIEKIVYEYLE